jgi:hypothetical protein
MSSLASRRPPVKSNTPRPPRRTCRPLPPVLVTGSFCGGATTADLLAGVAVLQIDRPEDTNDWYWCGYVVDGGRIIGVRLRKFGTGTVYFLPADLSECECPDCTFRQRACKHITALRQALSPLPAVASV